MQSTLLPFDAADAEPATAGGIHVAIIMDGNGRWAQRRGLPRSLGHKAGVGAIRRTVEAAPSLGVGMLTMFAFSADNWKRPASEVTVLMGLLQTYLHRERDRLADSGTRLTCVGRRDRLPGGIVDAIADAEGATVGGTQLHLRIALDYSARDAILAAAFACRDAPCAERGRLAAYLSPDVDLLIRTGGERRLSDFLLWECAYAELHFTEVMWPDFDGAALSDALADFHRRDRRFGGLAAPLTHASA